MARRLFSSLIWVVLAGMVAIGYGAYVYHSAPVVVWGLLFFCWTCYRLRMRAIALFSERKTRPLMSEPEASSERLNR